MKDLSKHLLVLGLLLPVGLRVNAMNYLPRKTLKEYAPYLLNIVIWGGGALAYRFYCNVNFKLDRNALIGLENRELIEKNGKKIDLANNELKEEIQTNGKLLSSIRDQQDNHTKQLSTIETLSNANYTAVIGTREELLKKFSNLHKDMKLLPTAKTFHENMSALEQDMQEIKLMLNQIKLVNWVIYQAFAKDRKQDKLPASIDGTMLDGDTLFSRPLPAEMTPKQQLSVDSDRKKWQFLSFFSGFF